MEIRHLRSFIALAEERQFTAAARKFHIVQSGLSVTIKEMEEELGVRLVERTTRNVDLTAGGHLFLEYARSSVRALNEGMEAVSAEAGVVRGSLHLGILQSLSPYVDLPRLLRTFRARYPSVDFAVRTVSTAITPAQVRSGQIDLSFYVPRRAEDLSGLQVTAYAEDSIVAICSSRHAWASRRSVNLDLLAGEPFVHLSPERALRELIDGEFAGQNLQRNSIYQVSDVGIMLQFVSEDLGVAIVPSALTSSFARSKKLHVLRLRSFDRKLPMWRISILTRQQGRRFAAKSTVDLFWIFFPNTHGVAHSGRHRPLVSLKGACERK